MIQSGFTVDERQATDEELSIIAALESANITHSLVIYKYNYNQEIVDFIDTPPKNSKEWADFISKKSIGEDLIKIYSNQIEKKCWDNIFRNTKCSEKFIESFMNNVNWDLVSEYQNLSGDFIKKHQDRINWKLISKNKKIEMSEKFIDQFQDKLDWNKLSEIQKLSEAFILQNRDKVNWDTISIYQKLSENFIIQNSEKINWNLISGRQELSNELIIKHKDKLNLEMVCYHQKIVESTIRELVSNFDKKCWSGISRNQTLSISFLEEFQKHINWEEFSQNRGHSLSEEVIRKYADKIHWYNFINSWSCPGLSEELVKEFLPLFSKSVLQHILGDTENFPLSKEYKKQLQELLDKAS